MIFLPQAHNGNQPLRLKTQGEIPRRTLQDTLKRLVQAGTERLRPVFEDLNGTIPYEELKLLRLHHLCLQDGKARHPLPGSHDAMNADPVKNIAASVFNNEKIKE
jgi:hypothetical protein